MIRGGAAGELELDAVRALPRHVALTLSAGELVDFAARLTERALADAAAAAVPPPDFDVAALATRERLSKSRVRELIAAGEWGLPGALGGPFRDTRGRWRVPVDAVLRRDAALRAAGRENDQQVTHPPVTPMAGSLRDRVRGMISR